jgi:hypothetical protein
MEASFAGVATGGSACSDNYLLAALILIMKSPQKPLPVSTDYPESGQVRQLAFTRFSDRSFHPPWAKSAKRHSRHKTISVGIDLCGPENSRKILEPAFRYQDWP